MLRDFVGEIGKIFVSPVLYILVLAMAGTGFIFSGVKLMFGDGAAFIALGILLLLYTVALCRSISRGE